MRPSLRVYLKVLKERGVKSFDILKKKVKRKKLEDIFYIAWMIIFLLKKLKL